MASEKPSLKVTDLPRLAMPVVEFIGDEKPDIVIGCDRGARLFSLAIHAMWQHTTGEPFPTLDHKIHFAKVSNDVSKRLLSQRLKYIVDESLKAATPNNDPLHVLFVEDWIHRGETTMTARQALGAHLRRSRTSFATMFGDKADVTGQEEELHVPFMDKPEEIGVDYEPHYTAAIAQVAQIVDSTKAKENRAKLYAACREYRA